MLPSGKLNFNVYDASQEIFFVKCYLRESKTGKDVVTVVPVPVVTLRDAEILRVKLWLAVPDANDLFENYEYYGNLLRRTNEATGMLHTKESAMAEVAKLGYIPNISMVEAIKGFRRAFVKPKEKKETPKIRLAVWDYLDDGIENEVVAGKTSVGANAEKKSSVKAQ